MRKTDLIQCFQDTLRKAEGEELYYPTLKAKRSNKVYKENFITQKRVGKEFGGIVVEENTTFNAARKYVSLGKVAVLNFANPVNPGGGAENGAIAQEECLCRSSNLYLCLVADNVREEFYGYHKRNKSYFYSNRLIYTKDITVFKDDADIPNLLPSSFWYNVDIITCAAPYMKGIKNVDLDKLKEVFKGRIKNIFEASLDNEVDVLVLGAFGCGAFRNPPEVVARAFYEVILENGYINNFKKIIFAIKKSVTEGRCNNLGAFIDEFSVQHNCFNRDPKILNFPIIESLVDTDSVSDYKAWKVTNPYYGKQTSVFGDSLSTLQNCNNDFIQFCLNEEDNHEIKMADMWWEKVISYFGGELLANESCHINPYEKLSPKVETRVNKLHKGGIEPNIVIINYGYDYYIHQG